MSTKKINVSGIEIDLDILGEGPPLLYLHPEHYMHLHEPFIAKLAQYWKVFKPRHPGFDGRKPPKRFRCVGDLAYLYLDLIEQLELQQVVLLGASFGGWIGIEIAIRDTARLNSLILVSPLGVKLGSREETDIVDLSALPEKEAASALFASCPADLSSFNKAQLIEVARDQQFLAYYAWKPFLHNPSLAHWLHRIKVPVQLIWGEHDGYVRTDFGKRLLDCIPDARMNIIKGAGHYPQIEKLEETVSALAPVLEG